VGGPPVTPEDRVPVNDTVIPEDARDEGVARLPTSTNPISNSSTAPASSEPVLSIVMSSDEDEFGVGLNSQMFEDTVAISVLEADIKAADDEAIIVQKRKELQLLQSSILKKYKRHPHLDSVRAIRDASEDSSSQHSNTGDDNDESNKHVKKRSVMNAALKKNNTSSSS
jgi:hypothetical protein